MTLRILTAFAAIVVSTLSAGADSLNMHAVGGASTPAYAQGVAVAGSYAYVTSDTFGLLVFDVSNPASPAQVGICNTPGQASDVVLSGSLAFVADNEAGLSIVDISSPTSPFLAGNYDTSAGSATCMAVSGARACVVYGGWLVVLDVSNPASPVQLGAYNMSHGSNGIAVSGDYAYICTGYFGLYAYNVSNPAAITLTGSFNTPGYAYGVTIDGSCAYICDDNGGLRIIDISDPAAMVERGAGAGNHAWQAVYDERIVYEADWGYTSTIRAINVRNPAAPVQVGFYDINPYAGDVAVSGQYIYVANGSLGLRIYRYYGPAGIADDDGRMTKPSPGDVTLRINGAAVEYSLRQAGQASLKVYNLLGQEVRTLFDGFRASGSYVSRWDGRNDVGYRASSGVYLVRLRTNSGMASGRTLLLR